MILCLKHVELLHCCLQESIFKEFQGRGCGRLSDKLFNIEQKYDRMARTVDGR